MKRYALSPVLLGSFLIFAIPLPSYAQLAAIAESSTPALLKVPQSLPPTIFNPSDDHPVLPVPPSTDISAMPVAPQTVREYIFQSGIKPESRSQSSNVTPVSSRIQTAAPVPIMTAISQPMP